jgi:hypothetical protein
MPPSPNSGKRGKCSPAPNATQQLVAGSVDERLQVDAMSVVLARVVETVVLPAEPVDGNQRAIQDGQGPADLTRPAVASPRFTEVCPLRWTH